MKKSILVKTIGLLLFSAIGCQSAISVAGEFVYRWKDGKGNYQYSDRAPLNANIRYEILTQGSVIVKKVVEKEKTEEELEQIKQLKLAMEKEQKEQNVKNRQDTALLATYSSVDDLQKKKNFELNQVDRNIENFEVVIEKLKKQNEGLESSKNSKLIMDKNNAEIENYEKDLSNLKALKSDIQTKYEKDEERLRQLLEEKKENSSNNQNKINITPMQSNAVLH